MIVRQILNVLGFDVDDKPIKNLDNSVKKSIANVKKLGATFNTVGRGMANAGRQMSMFVTLPLLGLAAFAVKASSEYEETMGKFNVVFGEASKGMQQWVVDFSRAVGRGEDELLVFMSTIQDTFVPLGFARDEAAKMSREVIKLAVDLASFNNMPTEEVIQSIQSALVGQTEPMRKFGVIISQQILDQELLNMGVRVGIKNASEQQKAQARLNVMFKGSKDAIGDAARTSTSFANVMVRMIARLKELNRSFGDIIKPVIKPFIKFIGDAAEKIKDLSAKTKLFILVTLGIAALVGPLMTIGGLFLIMIGHVMSAVAAIKAMGTAAIIAQAKLLLIPFVVLAIIALVALLAEDFYTFLTGGNSLIGRLVDKFEGLGEAIQLNAGLAAVLASALTMAFLSPIAGMVLFLMLFGFIAAKMVKHGDEWKMLWEIISKASVGAIDAIAEAIYRLIKAWQKYSLMKFGTDVRMLLQDLGVLRFTSQNTPATAPATSRGGGNVSSTKIDVKNEYYVQGALDNKAADKINAFSEETIKGVIRKEADRAAGEYQD